MSQFYFEKKDLAEFPKINEVAKEQGDKFFEYYGSATSEGLLSQREKALIALTVATIEKCPYCMDAYTNTCLSIGITEDEMMEAIHVGASMLAGITLAHATQVRRIVKQKEM
jgi:alkylhydroperoxidase/carboxymuconolactone decarboxylase family protein